jgi:diaminopropionate ammonia-lyase
VIQRRSARSDTWLVRNDQVQRGQYPAALREIISLAEHQRARTVVEEWPGYQPTNLYPLDSVARDLGLAAIWLKDESTRFGLGAFKSLGGAYAVYRMLEQHIRAAHPGAEVSPRVLIDGAFRELTSQITFACASAGNHGRAVAWGAHLFGARCVVYLYEGVSPGRRAAIESLGATVDASSPNYDYAVKRVAVDAERSGWLVLSDTAYNGYREIPRLVMQGYTIIAQEALEQLGDVRPTHVLVQAGVGGFGAAITAHFWEALGADRPRFIVVEPAGAACVQESIAQERLSTLAAAHSIMGGLNCALPSSLAWEVLQAATDWSVAIPDRASITAMCELAQHGIVSGESGAAGFAALHALCANPNARAELGLDQHARVLVFSTEGATDRDTYHALTGLEPHT